MLTDVFRVLHHLGDLLEPLGIRYVVGGSLASGVHGELRATNDIDVLVDLPDERVGELIEALKPTFDIWEDTVRQAVADRRSFSAMHVEWHIKIDFFPAGRSALDASELERREMLRMPAAPEKPVPVASAEDIVLRKLEWYRRSGDVLERQLRDVVGVLKLRGETLDVDYLRRWASELGVEDLLARVLA